MRSNQLLLTLAGAVGLTAVVIAVVVATSGEDDGDPFISPGGLSPAGQTGSSAGAAPQQPGIASALAGGASAQAGAASVRPPAGGANAGAGTVDFDGKQQALRLESCVLPASVNAPFLFNGKTGDGKGTIEVGGIAGAATIGLTYDNVQYIAGAAKVTFPAGGMSYDGQALKTGATSTNVPLKFQVKC